MSHRIKSKKDRIKKELNEGIENENRILLEKIKKIMIGNYPKSNGYFNEQIKTPRKSGNIETKNRYKNMSICKSNEIDFFNHEAKDIDDNSQNQNQNNNNNINNGRSRIIIYQKSSKKRLKNLSHINLANLKSKLNVSNKSESAIQAENKQVNDKSHKISSILPPIKFEKDKEDKLTLLIKKPKKFQNSYYIVKLFTFGKKLKIVAENTQYSDKFYVIIPSLNTEKILSTFKYNLELLIENLSLSNNRLVINAPILVSHSDMNSAKIKKKKKGSKKINFTNIRLRNNEYKNLSQGKNNSNDSDEPAPAD